MKSKKYSVIYVLNFDNDTQSGAIHIQIEATSAQAAEARIRELCLKDNVVGIFFLQEPTTLNQIEK